MTETQNRRIYGRVAELLPFYGYFWALREDQKKGITIDSLALSYHLVLILASFGLPFLTLLQLHNGQISILHQRLFDINLVYSIVIFAFLMGITPLEIKKIHDPKSRIYKCANFKAFEKFNISPKKLYTVNIREVMDICCAMLLSTLLIWLIVF